MTNNGNEPNLTLSDLYDKDVSIRYNLRISNPWLKPNRDLDINFLTGRY